jgi:hypothetical protein
VQKKIEGERKEDEFLAQIKVWSEIKIAVAQWKKFDYRQDSKDSACFDGKKYTKNKNHNMDMASSCNSCSYKEKEQVYTSARDGNLLFLKVSRVSNGKIWPTAAATTRFHEPWIELQHTYSLSHSRFLFVYFDSIFGFFFVRSSLSCSPLFFFIVIVLLLLLSTVFYTAAAFLPTYRFNFYYTWHWILKHMLDASSIWWIKN